MLVAVAAAAVLIGCSPGGTGALTTTRTVVSTRPPLTTLTITTGSAPDSDPHSRSEAPGGANSGDPAPSSPALGDPTGSDPAQSDSTGSDPAQSDPAQSDPAPTTSLAAAVSGSCPYLSADDAARVAGQRTGPGAVVAATPAPICVFTRSDGGWLAAVRVFRTPDAASAAAAIDERILIADSSPADDPTGWTGGYRGLPSGTPEYPEARSVYGVSKGTAAVVVWINQAQSIKGRRIVEAVIGNLQL